MKGRRLRVLGHFHAYPPKHNAGAEWMAHSILTHLHERFDVECRVIVGRTPKRKDTFDGIPVETVRSPQRSHAYYQWADVALTHLDETRKAMYQAKASGVPLVHLVHNDRQLTFHRVETGRCDLAVYNSRWLADAAELDVDSCVVFPPVWLDKYPAGIIEPPPVPCVAMLNMSEAKGAATFYRMAKLMPDVRFLAVRGSYGTQVGPPPELANVEWMRNQSIVMNVYRQASIVLMPSHYESWGRVVVEAAAAGRPSIAAPTPGLIETDVPCAFIDPDDTRAWIAETRSLLDPARWRLAAFFAYERARALEQQSLLQLEDFHERLLKLAN